MNTHTPLPEVDQEDIALDFLLAPKALDPLAYGGCPTPAKPTGTRLRVFATPSSPISTLDHLYGPGAALQLLMEHFGLKPGARFEESQATSTVAFLVDEGDYKRLGGQRFEREVATALQALVAEIPLGDALRATEQGAIQALIEADVLDRSHVEKLSEARRQDMLEGDLGL